MFRRPVPVVLLLFGVMLLGGCQTSRIALYDGPPKKSDEVAVLVTSYRYGAPKCVLHAVDGIMAKGNLYETYTGLPSYNSGMDDTFRIEILPGVHTLLVTHLTRSGGYVHFMKPVELRVDARPGVTYLLVANENAMIDVVERK